MSTRVIVRRPWLLLSVACVILALLWLPGADYPIVSDTAHYAVLGKNVWHGLGYTLNHEPYATHLPLNAVVSYPLVAILGPNLGMKVSSLIAGMAVLIVSFWLMSRQLSRVVGLGVVVFLLLHHGFVWMTVVGSADLLFTALALGSVLAYCAAENKKKFYLLSGALLGLSCLTRYNGVPLFGFYLIEALLKRKDDLRLPHYWIGLLLGAAIFGLWPLRNFLIFGDPLYTTYASELAEESLGPIAQVVSNFFYYANPLHNVLPILSVFALYGIAKLWRKQGKLIIVFACLEALTAIWWVQGIRFAFPGYPILMGFAVWGIIDLAGRCWRWQRFYLALVGVGLLITHLSAMCLYTFGACNAWFDRNVGLLPKNLGLSSEGFYTFDQARGWMNDNAEEGADVVVSYPEVWQEKFREDLKVVAESEECPAYRITQEPGEGKDVVFMTRDSPVTSVVREGC